MIRIRPAPYHEDCSALAASARRPARAVLFVSGGQSAIAMDRWSVALAEPLAWIEAEDARAPIRLVPSNVAIPVREFSDFRKAVEAALAITPRLPAHLISTPWSAAHPPFTGGLAGYLDYEFGARFERAPLRERVQMDRASGRPAFWMGVFASAYVADRLTGRAWRVDREVAPEFERAAERSAAALDAWIDAAPSIISPSEEPRAGGPRHNERAAGDFEGWEISLDRSAHAAALARAREYLVNGDVYQINLTARLTRDFSGDAGETFASLARANPNPFAVFIGAPEWSILSASPELFFDLRGDGWIETRPIKGTRRVSEQPDAWREAAEALAASAKDRAEHLMIVDLERSDLGRVCEPGTIHVDPFMTIEAYPGLAHMVSAVRGRMRRGLGSVDALAALFPGGSITGAPKIRAMEIIHELEPAARGVYTGAIGWITPEGEARFNVAIRTLVAGGGKLSLGLGGGIVMDSEAEAEWEELKTKAAAILRGVG